MKHTFVHQFGTGSRQVVVLPNINNLKSTAEQINALEMTQSEEVIDWRVEILNTVFNALQPKQAGKLIELLK